MKQLVIFYSLAVLLTACASPKTITITEYRDRVRIDTVLVESERVDSTYQSHYTYLGDTIRLVDTIYRFRLKYVDKVQMQYEYIHDSIPYPVEVEKKVRARNGYDRFTSWGFWILTLLTLARVAWWAFKTFYLRR